MSKLENGLGSSVIQADGKVIIKLEEVINNTEGMNKYRLSKMTGIRYDTICNYCKNTVTLINKEYLKIFCNVLDCKIEDIIEYIEK